MERYKLLSLAASVLFLTDRWVFTCCINDLAPAVVAAVPIKTRKSRTVAEAFQGNIWSRDVQGGLSLVGLFEYFQLWDSLQEMVLSDDEEDNHIWRLDCLGINLLYFLQWLNNL